MPASNNPIFINRPKVGFSNTVTAANITKNLTTGTLNPTLFQANTETGSYLDHVRARPLGTNVASMARIFLHNGQPGGTGQANNNCMMTEVSLQATTLSEIYPQPEVVVPLKIAIPPGYNVHVTLATAVAAGWTFAAFGGDY